MRHIFYGGVLLTKDEAQTLRRQGKSLYEIADIIQRETGKTQRKSWDKAHYLLRGKTNTQKPVGIVGDVHAPFDHPNYLQFCRDTFKKYGCGTTVFIGDLIDHHAVSQYVKETCADNSKDEHSKAYNRVREYFKAFPKAVWMLGNHDLRPQKAAAAVGMDEVFLKPMRELYGVPKGWAIEEETVIDDVLYKHGINCLGKDGALNAAIQERMSTVIGHAHSWGGCKYSANKRNIIFGLNVGCGLDVRAYAAAYGKHDKNRPTLGCGVVFDKSNAIFVPMGFQYFRD